MRDRIRNEIIRPQPVVQQYDEILRTLRAEIFKSIIRNEKPGQTMEDPQDRKEENNHMYDTTIRPEDIMHVYSAIDTPAITNVWKAGNDVFPQSTVLRSADGWKQLLQDGIKMDYYDYPSFEWLSYRPRTIDCVVNPYVVADIVCHSSGEKDGQDTEETKGTTEECVDLDLDVLYGAENGGNGNDETEE